MTTPNNTYEAPALTTIGSLGEITKGGTLPVNELRNQPVVNNDAFGIVS